MGEDAASNVIVLRREAKQYGSTILWRLATIQVPGMVDFSILDAKDINLQVVIQL